VVWQLLGLPGLVRMHAFRGMMYVEMLRQHVGLQCRGDLQFSADRVEFLETVSLLQPW
jgi:hypothetical protein